MKKALAAHYCRNKPLSTKILNRGEEERRTEMRLSTPSIDQMLFYGKALKRKWPPNLLFFISTHRLVGDHPHLEWVFFCRYHILYFQSSKFQL